jgi:hypothetical protein
MGDAISELVARCDQEEAVTIADIDRLRMSVNMTRDQFYESAMLFVAEAFHRGDLAFETADAVANCLWGVSEFSLTGRARDVFLAFDEGEYHHRQDSEGSDPVELYTRPQIEAILGKRRPFE